MTDTKWIKGCCVECGATSYMPARIAQAPRPICRDCAGVVTEDELDYTDAGDSWSEMWA